MSLRRSARLSTNSLTATPEVESPNGVVNGDAKGASKASRSTSKKRKSRASATSAAVSTQDESAKKTTKLTETEFAVPEIPKTPISKQRKAAAATTPSNPPPLTPTPSGVGLMVSTTAVPIPNNEADAQPRPTEPHATNAPLSTPGGSRVVAYSSSPIKPLSASQEETASPSKKKKAKEVVPPDVGAMQPPTSTVDTLLKDACEHLCKIDPKLKALIEKHHCKMFSPEGLREVVDPFTALASGIIGQQVSGQAAASIRKKFTALFPETDPSFPAPAHVIQKDLATLRTAGLSQRKAEYIQGLAEKFASGELSAQILVSASDEDLIEKLVAVRGLGRWSVEMFACFGLKRMDVFSTGDLGVQRGMATYMGKDVSKLKAKGGKWKYMTEKEMLDIAAKFSPYRSLFMWYMWRIENVDISVMNAD
ncbi:DNA glycosylase [Zopfia rhizophila CBS 207.26]|uniref:DNA glycosylase n=1 Tax=Zopfia rhizophila CBS 207.26 TaxID=1314779 RepID=A0A6A6E1D0_9PEZI|nr:DNA glycosylase [Zopfia rhizophila CBS 207.26]